MNDLHDKTISKIEKSIGRISSIEKIVKGFSSVVYIAKTKTGNYLIKHSGGGDINTDFEASFLQYLKNLV